MGTAWRRNPYRSGLDRCRRRRVAHRLTVLGDTVNTTARLASAAAAGEILVTSDAAPPRRPGSNAGATPLDLKGKHLATMVVSLWIRPPN